MEEPDFTEAENAKMLEEAEGVFRDLASQMRAFAQNGDLGCSDSVRSGDGKCGADWHV